MRFFSARGAPWQWQVLLPQPWRGLCRRQRVDSPRAVAVVLSVCTERVSFAMAPAGAFATCSGGTYAAGSGWRAFSLARSDFRSPQAVAGAFAA